jgi:hypothetical protein
MKGTSTQLDPCPFFRGKIRTLAVQVLFWDRCVLSLLAVGDTVVRVAALSKAHIVAQIKRTAEENDGVALGAERFADTTGIGIGVWRGKYWATWSDALVEAGFEPNRPHDAHPREKLIECMIAQTRRLGRFPTYADLRMARQADPTFPAHHAFSKLGSLPVRVAMLRSHASSDGAYSDVLALLPSPEDSDQSEDAGTARADGAVYMLKLGKHYKIGKSFRVPQRHREIAIELPEKPDVVHVITTDDPSGIEGYWHARFADKRTNGEWFALSLDDVRAFKRRKFM